MYKLTIKLIVKNHSIEYSVLEQSEELRHVLNVNQPSYIFKINGLECHICSNSNPALVVLPYYKILCFYTRGFSLSKDNILFKVGISPEEFKLFNELDKDVFLKLKGLLLKEKIDFNIVTNLFKTNNLASKF